jgi:hypothetical protein
VTRQDQLTPTQIDDVNFFRANPDRRHRLRPSSAAEVLEKLGVEVGEASAASGTWYAAVKKFDPVPEGTVTACYILPVRRVFAVAEPPTFDLDDEDIARRVFSAVFGRRG